MPDGMMSAALFSSQASLPPTGGTLMSEDLSLNGFQVRRYLGRGQYASAHVVTRNDDVSAQDEMKLCFMTKNDALMNF